MILCLNYEFKLDEFSMNNFFNVIILQHIQLNLRIYSGNHQFFIQYKNLLMWLKIYCLLKNWHFREQLIYFEKI
ncbi:unnamed protein product [Paramecium sonneborni]|uniref:Uncharacterized protein n=1 Tax=Paramecium sonneborni TaxID=65129 RepID=A0A8S1QYH2_9CILI|nr:unnamed protein product [Paramecium sonneborni]